MRWLLLAALASGCAAESEPSDGRCTATVYSGGYDHYSVSCDETATARYAFRLAGLGSEPDPSADLHTGGYALGGIRRCSRERPDVCEVADKVTGHVTAGSVVSADLTLTFLSPRLGPSTHRLIVQAPAVLE